MSGDSGNGTGVHSPFTLPHSSIPQPSHHHIVHLYDDDALLIERLVDIVEPALRAGNGTIVLATPAHRAALELRLAACGIDLPRAKETGAYVTADAQTLLHLCLVNDWPNDERFRKTIGALVAGITPAADGTPRRIAIFGELVALLSAEGRHDAAIELEQHWNTLLQTHDFELICAYPMSAFTHAGDHESFARICSIHSDVVPLDTYTALASEPERRREVALLQQKARTLQFEIAERERISRTLVERNRELQAAVATRDEFLTVAAHELRTPLAGLRVFVQLLIRDINRDGTVSAARLERALLGIDRQSSTLDHLVSRLLDVGQIDAHTLRINRTPADLVPLIHAAIARQQLGESHAITYQGPLELVTSLDPDRIEQVIANLLENAATFGPTGGPVRIELGLENGAVRLAVIDAGIGIAPAEREAVFNRFYRGEHASPLAGLGLSLFISRELIALHGGSIRFEEPAGPGAVCVVTLPASPAADSRATNA